MPTKKPILQVVVDDSTLDTIKAICEIENRSASNLTNKLINDFIVDYTADSNRAERLKIQIEKVKNDKKKKSETAERLQAYAQALQDTKTKTTKE